MDSEYTNRYDDVINENESQTFRFELHFNNAYIQNEGGLLVRATRVSDTVIGLCPGLDQVNIFCPGYQGPNFDKV